MQHQRAHAILFLAPLATLLILLGCGASSAAVGSSPTATATMAPPTAIPTVDVGAVTLDPGKTITIYLNMDYPAVAATYSFAFGVQADSSPTTFPVVTAAIFLDKNANKWSGGTCLTKPAYLAVIPSTGPEQFYVCPAA